MTEKENLKKYRLSWPIAKSEADTTIFNRVVLWAESEQQLQSLVNALAPDQQGTSIEVLQSDPLAALVAEGVKKALHEVGKEYAGEGWRWKDLTVKRTADAGRFCVRVLISRDLSAIEGCIRKRFVQVEDIGCSETDPPELDPNKELGEWPNSEGLHEWVCILQIDRRAGKVPPHNLTIGVTYRLQHVITWFDDAPHLYRVTTGRDIEEATETELFALVAAGVASLELVIMELGGHAYTDHRELCEDGFRFVGMVQIVKLSLGNSE